MARTTLAEVLGRMGEPQSVPLRYTASPGDRITASERSKLGMGVTVTGRYSTEPATRSLLSRLPPCHPRWTRQGSASRLLVPVHRRGVLRVPHADIDQE